MDKFDIENWEKDGGRRAEYIADWKNLCDLVDIDGCQMISPLETDRPEPRFTRDQYQEAIWHECWRWRCRLEAAAGEEA